MLCPTISDVAVLTDDPLLAASLSCVLARKRQYLPVFDGPRMTRQDHPAEVIRRTNAVARTKAQKAYIGELPANALLALLAKLPAGFACEVTVDMVPELALDRRIIEVPRLKWGRDHLGQGLLRALYSGQLLEFDDRDSPIDDIAPKLDHLVVCEAGEQLSEIIAANYAYSLGAGFHLADRVSVDEAKALMEAFYSIDGPDKHPAEIRARVLKRFRELCGDFKIPASGSITFVTNGLPVGTAYPEVPSTHLFAYPDLGIQIVNGLAFEQDGTRGTNVAVLVDPGVVHAPEIEAAAKSLSEKRIFVRGYQGRGASVRAVTEMLDWLPYDLLIFATHCGDAPGYRWTYEFTDSEGLERTLVVDIAVGVAPTDDPDLLSVTQFVRFHSLDGVDWNDEDAKQDLNVGSAIRDYFKWTAEKRLEPIKKENIDRVLGSAVMAMVDGQFIPISQQLAGRGSPIIINNACVSWHELSSRLTFANCRAYIGTLISVSNGEAEAFLVRLIGKQFGKPLAHAVWSAQNAVYGEGSDRRPYAVTGVYPQRLRVTKEDVPVHVYRRMQTELRECEASLCSLPENASDHYRRSMTSAREYYRKEIRDLYNRWISPPDGE